MNEDRGTHGQEVTGGGAQARPGQVNDHPFAAASLDGPGGDGGPVLGPADLTERRSGTPGVTAGDGQPGAADMTAEPAEPGDAGATGEEEPPGAAGVTQRTRRKKRRAGRSWWVELPILLIFALVLALVIKTFVVQAFYIPSSSMENTLEIGDKVLVNKLIYDFRLPHRGDIVVFNGDASWNAVPAQPKPLLPRLWSAISGLFGTAPGVHDYIKRVIGVPGDHVVCCDRQHRITVNGVPLNEGSYLYPRNAPSATPFNITVPPGRLWVMGDHRSVSDDSRGHRQDPGAGTIPEDHVVGRAFMIIAPISRWGILSIPGTFQQPRLAAASAAALAATPAAPLSLGLSAAPGAPLALGLTAAIPLTWLQRRLRRRLGKMLRGHLRRPSGRGLTRLRGPRQPGPGLRG